MGKHSHRYGSEEALLDGLRSGEQQAIEHLYHVCYPSFASYLSGHGGSAEDARDCFQEGVLTAWVNVRNGNYQPRQNVALTTYVIAICKYKWMNKVRSAYNRKISFPEDLPDLQTPEVDEHYEETLKHLAAGMSQMGPNCQEIFRMFYFERMSYEEMQARTGKQADSLKNQKYRCLERLREIINTIKTEEQ